MCTYIYIYIYICYIHRERETCMYICIYTYMYVHIHIVVLQRHGKVGRPSDRQPSVVLLSRSVVPLISTWTRDHVCWVALLV